MKIANSKPLTRIGLAVILCGSAAALSAQSFDTSGNGTVKGDYFVRQVVLTPDQTTSAIDHAQSLTGIMTFDGAGNYSFTGQLMDSQVGSAQTYSTTGVYSVSSSGQIQIQSPIDNTDTEYGGVGAPGPGAIVASATEYIYDDIFVAIPAGSGAGNGTVSGSYQVGFIDFLQGNASQVRDGYFSLASNGSGSFGTVSVNGSMANQNNTNVTQSLSGVTYSITGANGSGTITFPTASNVLTELVSGQKTLYVSADGNLILGGTFNGYDIFVGTKSSSGVTNSSFSGTYYETALENDTSGYIGIPNNIDSFYGSTNANGQGVDISHWRLVGFDYNAFDYTTDDVYTLSSNGTYNSPAGYQYMLGDNGQVMIIVGTGPYYSLNVLIHAKAYSGSGVFLNPIGITNAASFAPITNSVAPGEMITLFGTGMGPSTLTLAPSVPLTTNLANVQVLVNGVAAPLVYVSATQITLIVPWETPADSFATFQVSYNNTLSNQVTVYSAYTAPGVFTTTANGVGPAAVTHADGSLVSSSSPATAGETLVLYMTGLGSVTPAGTDGQPGLSTSPFSTVDDPNLEIDILDSQGNDQQSNSIAFAGLTPQFPGEYQVNFTVPTGLAGGLGYVDVGTTEGYTTEAMIYISGSTTTTGRAVSSESMHGRPALQHAIRSRKHGRTPHAVRSVVTRSTNTQ